MICSGLRNIGPKMQNTIVLTTFDWVPDFAQGYVRDIRVRWLLEELGRPYEVDTVPNTLPNSERSAAHLARQPFGQVPFIRDGQLSLFESGAILMHLSEGTAMMPEGEDRARTLQWLCAALNSVEPMTMQWVGAKFFDQDAAAAEKYGAILHRRLTQLQAALADREWLVANRFTVADLLMTEGLRSVQENGLAENLPQLDQYISRALSRPAFKKAHADQMAHWTAADAALSPA